MNIALVRAEADMRLMKSSGYALGAIARLLSDNAIRGTYEGQLSFLDGYLEGGLHEAIRLIAASLAIAAEDLESLIEEKKAGAEGGAQ